MFTTGGPSSKLTLSISNTTFSGNTTTNYGMFYMTNNSVMDLDSCTFENNTGKSGYGMIQCHGTYSGLKMTNCVLQGNRDFIAVVYSVGRDSVLEITDSYIQDNTCSVTGAIAINNASSKLTITGGEISGNTRASTNTSESIWGTIYSNGTLIMDDVTVSNNVCAYTSGIYVYGSTATLTNCRITGNVSSDTTAGTSGFNVTTIRNEI